MPILLLLLNTQYAFPFSSNIQNFIASAVRNHALVSAARADVDAAGQRTGASRKDWYPTVTYSDSTGREKLRKPSSETSLRFRERSLSLEQKLWDFGDTRAKINKAGLGLKKAEIKLFAIQQQITLQALTAILEISKTSRILGFAQKSEKNIRKQTGLEEIMVQAGSGYTTDVLQAKTQLAGAAARRISARLGLDTAVSRYRIIFPQYPDLSRLKNSIAIPERFLPSSLVLAEQLARENNTALLLTRLDSSISSETVRQTTAEELAPSLEFSLEQNWKKNAGGVAGEQEETIGKLEFNMPLNLGFTAFNTISAARSDEAAARHRVTDSYRQVLSTVRQAWHQFRSSRQLYNARKEQASIAQAFLVLARKERELGKRSLLDVLSGETTLINAQSDAAAARADLTVAGYGLLAAMGTLKIKHIVTR